MIDFDLDDARASLARTPAVLRGLAGDLDDRWARANYGPKTFSTFDVVGHLVHGERVDWMPRARIILESGEQQAFDPYIIEEMYAEMEGRSMGDLLELFETLRAGNLRDLDRLDLTAAQLGARGLHPAIGPVTMENLLATWVVHDLHHVAQICKAQARQYRDALGPWAAGMGILG